MRKNLTYKQAHRSKAAEVFPLLCPVREVEWLDGWDFAMIHSDSGLVEKGCVFSTSHHGKTETLWVVTTHDTINHLVEFVRFTPQESIVQIRIQVSDTPDGSESNINYTYTGLKPNILINLEEEFENNMIWWEKSINHFLATGKKLER